MRFGQSWSARYFSPEDLKRIENAVAEAETYTCGEIVPVIVKRSSTIGHLPFILMTLGILLFFLSGVESWHPSFLSHPWWLFLGWLVILIPLTRYLSGKPSIQYLFVNAHDRELQAHQRARLEFYEAKLDTTVGSTGILLFVSLMERYAVVLADRAISSRLPAETWNEVVALMIEGARSHDLATGFCRAIEKCQIILAPHFPIREGDENELSNHLIIKD